MAVLAAWNLISATMASATLEATRQAGAQIMLSSTMNLYARITKRCILKLMYFKAKAYGNST